MLEVNKDHLDLDGEASLVNSNKMLKQKNLQEEKYYQRLFYGSGQVKVALAEFDDDFVSGDLIGGKAEFAVSHSRLAYEVSPAKLDFKLLQADANAGIENYSVGVGAKVSAIHSELVVNPLNWFGYEPLEEWFGLEWDPYIGIEASLGSVGASVKAGLNNELYAAYGIGLGIKFGAEKNEE
jgi:toxin YxiD